MTRQTLLALAAGLVLGCGGGQAETPLPNPGETPPTAGGDTTAKPDVDNARERVDTSFKSAALGVEKPISILLPPGYKTSDKNYPVVYMLHGLGGYQESWLRIGIDKAADEVGIDAIIVMPDGDDGFYVNWQDKTDYDACLKTKRPFGKEPQMTTYCVREPRYADYITKDLIAFVDANYRTIAERSGRAIGGLSMGGYGALVSAFSHPELFSAVASHAGVASLRYIGPDPFVAKGAKQFDNPEVIIKNPTFGFHFKRIFGTDVANWIARDPVSLAENLKDGQLAIYLDAGTNDIFRLHNGAGHLAEVLTDRGITHEFHLIDGGGHDMAFWQARIDDSLRFFAEHFSARAP